MDEKLLEPEEVIIGVDKKLAELMMKGWVLLSELCPLESCGCPLMKNLDGQKYCCGCEMWHFDGKERSKKQKFGELVFLQANQRNQLQLKQNNQFNFTLSDNVIQSSQLKLAYLSSILNRETDLTKTYRLLLIHENIKASSLE